MNITKCHQSRWQNSMEGIFTISLKFLKKLLLINSKVASIRDRTCRDCMSIRSATKNQNRFQQIFFVNINRSQSLPVNNVVSVDMIFYKTSLSLSKLNLYLNSMVACKILSREKWEIKIHSLKFARNVSWILLSFQGYLGYFTLYPLRNFQHSHNHKIYLNMNGMENETKNVQFWRISTDEFHWTYFRCYFWNWIKFNFLNF